ncbi:hypothetical protein DNTS_015610 [Danionella cerebrum]|uniref:NACHT domain-containing protein n=1 Tax=Danionella cerebrum TaxID=2873325 RepID=A0A553QSD9_9TELE|nr:hypothetical protein DNTS_015610 [Danionella translucida]
MEDNVEDDGEIDERKLTVVCTLPFEKDFQAGEGLENAKASIFRGCSGAHALVLVLCIDCSFADEEKSALEKIMEPLGKSVWNHTLVLFSVEEEMVETPIEMFIASEGDALQWLIEKCGKRYHVLNNKNWGDRSQVGELLEKIDKMVVENQGCTFEMSKKMLLPVKEKRAKQRRMKFERKEREIDEKNQEEIIRSDPISVNRTRSIDIPLNCNVCFPIHWRKRRIVANLVVWQTSKDHPMDTTPCPELSNLLRDIRIDVQSTLRRRFQCLDEDLLQTRSLSAPLKDVYTELYITEGENVLNKHEVRWIETAHRRATEERPILLEDIFKPLSGQDHSIRSVLTHGVAGIGKTVCVQKFILDWAEGEANQDVHLIFPLPFRELNLLRDKTSNLNDLLEFFMDTKQLDLSQLEAKVIFILDGLDECRLSLDFQNSLSVYDVTQPAPVEVLVTNLIAGNLLPSARVWITSRPAAADLIPSKFVDRVTEVQGFNDTQKEEYISKRIRDQTLADKIISHLKSSRSLFIMCQIPVFCLISATVLEKILPQGEEGEIPSTLTQMYTYYLMVQVKLKNERPLEKNISDEDMVLKLGKLAFLNLKKHNLIFYMNDLEDCGINMQEASLYSGLFTEIFREESGLQGKVYTFVHLSIQEHLAALYVYFCFVHRHTNQLKQPGLLSIPGCLTQRSSIFDLQQAAVKEALSSSSGHLDMFLRFLLGFSLKSSQYLLKNLWIKTESGSDSTDKIVVFIKEKIKENLPPEKLICLFHCLNELNEHSLVEEIQGYVQAGSKINTKLTVSQWSAMVFVLLTSGQKLDVFDLNDYIGPCISPEESLQRLHSVVEASKTAKLYEQTFSRKCFTTLVSILTSKTSSLRELHITRSNIDDNKFKTLCAGLESLQCKLEVLRLEFCSLSDKVCDLMASALKSNPSHLKELDLSGNKFSYFGLRNLLTELQNPACKLEKLCMRTCDLKVDVCAALASLLKSEPSSLRQLNLSKNEFGDSGTKLLVGGLGNPHSELKILKLESCGITHEGCAALAAALKSNPSHLRELDLSGNQEIGNTGARLENCNITSEGCVALARALRLNPMHLKVLDLTWNMLGDSGVKELSSAFKNPHSNLKVLRLRDCHIDLSQNKMGTSGVKMLSSALENPDCKLEILRVCWSPAHFGRKAGVHPQSITEHDKNISTPSMKVNTKTSASYALQSLLCPGIQLIPTRHSQSQIFIHAQTTTATPLTDTNLPVPPGSCTSQGAHSNLEAICSGLNRVIRDRPLILVSLWLTQGPNFPCHPQLPEGKAERQRLG